MQHQYQHRRCIHGNTTLPPMRQIWSGSHVCHYLRNAQTNAHIHIPDPLLHKAAALSLLLSKYHKRTKHLKETLSSIQMYMNILQLPRFTLATIAKYSEEVSIPPSPPAYPVRQLPERVVITADDNTTNLHMLAQVHKNINPRIICVLGIIGKVGKRWIQDILTNGSQNVEVDQAISNASKV